MDTAKVKLSYQMACVISGLENEANDCSVKALAITGNLQYKQAQETLAKAGRIKRRGVNSIIIHRAYTGAGLSLVGVFGLSRWNNGTRMACENTPILKGCTLGSFAKMHSKGSYVAIVTGHAVPVIDGIIADDTPAGKRVHVAYVKAERDIK